MDILRFEEYDDLIKEQSENSSQEAIEIDLDDADAKIELNKKYSFLGVEFTPTYTVPFDKSSEPYRTIITKPGVSDGKEMYWGKVVHATSLEELQNEIRVEIKFYIDDPAMRT